MNSAKSYEDYLAADKYRRNYLQSVENIIKTKQKQSYIEREKFAAGIIENQSEAREQFKQMLGWPLTIDRPKNINVRITKADLERPFDIYRMEFEIFEGFWFYGILLKHNDNEKHPFIISQHGMLGTPELSSGFFDSTRNYNRMNERLVSMGANVFAPQLLLWNMKDYQLEYDRVRVDKDLKQLGGSITALEIYCIQSALDYFENQDYVEQDRIYMSGLSYGGFYTMFCTAVDTRIKKSLSCSQFNDRIEHNWSDWTWFNSANTFTDAEIAILIYPRKFTVCVGDNDEGFKCETAKAEYGRLKKLMTDYDMCNFDFHVFSGEHEFIKDDDIIKKALFD